MMPTPTEVNTEDIRDLRQSNKEIVAAIVDLKHELVDLKLEMVRRLEHLETRIDHYSGLTRFTATIVGPAIIALIGFAFWASFRAGEVNNRLDQVERAQSHATAK
jgi:hypothetical protein